MNFPNQNENAIMCQPDQTDSLCNQAEMYAGLTGIRPGNSRITSITVMNKRLTVLLTMKASC